MAILTQKQIETGYFKNIGGFPNQKIIHTLAEYDGAEQCCIACTQLTSATPREQKQILNDWISFLTNNTDVFTALHFNSRVPQSLFDAACCQKNLTELRFKWGRYPELSALTNLHHLRFLYLGSNPSALDLTPLTYLRDLVVLYLENFKQIEDYSPLAALQNLEQLTISGPILTNIKLQDLEFLRQMPQLRSFHAPNTRLRKPYSTEEWNTLVEELPYLSAW